VTVDDTGAMLLNRSSRKCTLRFRKMIVRTCNLDPEHLATNDPRREVLANLVGAQRGFKGLAITHNVLECWRAKLVPTLVDFSEKRAEQMNGRSSYVRS
jgi:hypothetical protein